MPRTMQRRSRPAGDTVVGNTPSRSVDPARTALAQALQAQREAEERVKFLEENLYRANTDHSDRYYDLTAATNELERAQRDLPIELAERYVYQTLDTRPAPALQAAEEAYKLAEREYQKITQIENAIAAELARNIDTASAAKVKVGQAIADVVAPIFPRLLQRMNDHWIELRSIRAVCDLIARSCASQLPAAWLTAYQENQPLAADRVGFPVNQNVQEWSETLEKLAQDADTPLPE